MTYALEVEKLNKTFGSKQVVYNLSFNVGKGDIFGFLGPNGAGKTTTIRIILGLIHPDSGLVKINGHNLKTDFNNAIQGVGAVVETPKFYLYLTAYENLLLTANLHSEVPRSRIDEVLEIVGLKKDARQKVRNYSLGMKQRLGLARALLNYPRLVFLDEPTNGLDPQGMQQIREMISQLAIEQDITFFITSHLLYEVEQICNRVAIIKEGKLVTENTVKNLLNRDTEMIEVLTPEPDKAVNVLQMSGLAQTIQPSSLGVNVEIRKGDSMKLNEYLVTHHIPVEYLIPKNQSLEQHFLKLTEGGRDRVCIIS